MISQNLQKILTKRHLKNTTKRHRFNFVSGCLAVIVLFVATLLPYELHFSRLSGRGEVGEVIDTNIPTTDMVFVAPAAAQGSLPLSEGMGDRYVIVSLADQKMEAYDNGQRVFEAIVSTGRPGRDTPRGVFNIVNKHPRAYSKVAALWMPYWMAFHHDGEYWLGFHELPEWGNGVKEGEEHLGLPFSGGCIRLGVGPAQQLYDWAEPGDTILIY